jgi:hypothetical protein
MHIITDITKLPEQTICSLQERAIQRGYDPLVSKQLLLKYIEDAPRSGRPSIPDSVRDVIIQVITKNSITRQYSTNRITAKASSILAKAKGKPKSVSPCTCYRVLKAAGYALCKQTVKPGLTQEMKDTRFE